MNLINYGFLKWFQSKVVVFQRGGKHVTMRKLPVLIFICLSISRSLQQQQKKSKFYILNTYKYRIHFNFQANLRGHAKLKVDRVFFRLWMALSHTRSVTRLVPNMTGALSRVIGMMEYHQSLRLGRKERIGHFVKRSQAAHMVRLRIPNVMIKLS